MRKWHRTRKLMRKNWVLYLFLLPAVLYIGVFHYAPMYGVQLAFKDFSPSLGVWGSPYVGMKYFNMFFKSPRFKMLLVNTIVVSAYNLLPGPGDTGAFCTIPQHIPPKKFAQTVTYAPHISTVVLVGMLNIFLSPSSGFVNSIIKALGFQPIYFLARPAGSGMYTCGRTCMAKRRMGLDNIHGGADGRKSELHEAAIIDGATKLQRIWHIDIPTIMSTCDNTAYYEPEQYYERGI